MKKNDKKQKNLFFNDDHMNQQNKTISTAWQTKKMTILTFRKMIRKIYLVIVFMNEILNRTLEYIRDM